MDVVICHARSPSPQLVHMHMIQNDKKGRYTLIPPHEQNKKLTRSGGRANQLSRDKRRSGVKQNASGTKQLSPAVFRRIAPSPTSENENKINVPSLIVLTYSSSRVFVCTQNQHLVTLIGRAGNSQRDKYTQPAASLVLLRRTSKVPRLVASAAGHFSKPTRAIAQESNQG